MENKLTIRSIARLFGMSAEALRFYEREGIVQPMRNAQNGYRYFDKYAIFRLSNCKRLRSLHFSVQETNHVLKDKTLETFIPLLEAKKEELYRTIQWEQQVAEFMEEYLSTLQSVQSSLNRFDIVESPEILYLLHHENDSIITDKTLNSLFPLWVEKMPLVRIFSLISGDSVVDRGKALEKQGGYAVTGAHARLLGFSEDGEHVRRVPSQTCVRTVLFVSSNEKSLNSRFDRALNFIRDQGLQLRGDPWGFQLFANYTDLQTQGNTPAQKKVVGDVYYEYYLPVSKKP